HDRQHRLGDLVRERAEARAEPADEHDCEHQPPELVTGLLPTGALSADDAGALSSGALSSVPASGCARVTTDPPSSSRKSPGSGELPPMSIAPSSSSRLYVGGLIFPASRGANMIANAMPSLVIRISSTLAM